MKAGWGMDKRRVKRRQGRCENREGERWSREQAHLVHLSNCFFVPQITSFCFRQILLEISTTPQESHISCFSFLKSPTHRGPFGFSQQFLDLRSISLDQRISLLFGFSLTVLLFHGWTSHRMICHCHAQTEAQFCKCFTVFQLSACTDAATVHQTMQPGQCYTCGVPHHGMSYLGMSFNRAFNKTPKRLLTCLYLSNSIITTFRGRSSQDDSWYTNGYLNCQQKSNVPPDARRTRRYLMCQQPQPIAEFQCSMFQCWWSICIILCPHSAHMHQNICCLIPTIPSHAGGSHLLYPCGHWW